MVPGFGHDAHEREALENAPGKRGIDAADQHHGNRAQLYLPRGVSHRVRGRSAAAGDHVAQAAKAKTHADLTGHSAHGPAGNAEYADLLDLAGVIHLVLRVRKIMRATAR